MDVFYDLDNKTLSLRAIGSDERERIKIRQTEDIRLKFHRGGTSERLAASAGIYLGVKAAKSDTSPLASTSDFTRPDADDGWYTASLNLNTTQITTDLFDANAELDDVEAFIEVTWAPAAAPTEKRRSDDLVISLVRSVFTGDEGTPSDATTPSDYSTTEEADARYLRWLSSVTGLTGGGATNLDGMTTVGVTVGLLVALALSEQLQVWLLKSGTSAEDAANGIVRPDDYNGATNAKVWQRII